MWFQAEYVQDGIVVDGKENFGAPSPQLIY